MPLREITLRDFTVFADARLDLCPGINVLIGANATGKTHAMKAAYALLSEYVSPAPSDTITVVNKLLRVFRSDGVWSLIRGAQTTANGISVGETALSIELRIADDQSISLSFASAGFHSDRQGAATTAARPLFIPSREVLSMFEGFIAAYQNRELAFDETFYDLCVALSAAPLRGERAVRAVSLVGRLEPLLGGKVVLDGTRFYIQSTADNRFESHVVAEGLRKLASIAHLVANGSIAPGSVLFWDEPETNLNPGLIIQLTDILIALSQEGVQVVLATHDYLLSHRLSLLAEYNQVPPDTLRFFNLARANPDSPVTISSGSSLAELPQNPILEEFARHYDFERAMFDKSHGG